MSNITVFKKLEALREEKAKLDDALVRATHEVDRLTLIASRNEYQQKSLTDAINWKTKIVRRVTAIDLNIRTLELGVNRLTMLSKGCTTASGKRIRV